MIARDRIEFVHKPAIQHQVTRDFELCAYVIWNSIRENYRLNSSIIVCDNPDSAVLSAVRLTEFYQWFHPTTPFMSSRKRFSISRISAAMTSGGRGGL